MSKLLVVMGVSAMVLMGCDSHDANAQSQVSADVGNPDSANMLVIQEGYEVIAPVAPTDNNMIPDSDNPGVEVAPAGNDMPTGGTVAPVQGNPVEVDESVSETVSPDGVAYEIDESVN